MGLEGEEMEIAPKIKAETKTNVGKCCNEIQQMPQINMQNDDVYRPKAESLKTTKATITRETITTMANYNNVP